MNKIEELLCSEFDVDFENFYDEDGIASALEYEYHRTYNPHKIVNVIKEYAEYYAKRCLAEVEYQGAGFIGNPTIRPTQIKLPEHE